VSFAEHFDAMTCYRAAAIRIIGVHGEPDDVMEEGGGLEEAFPSVGRGPLLAVLADPAVQAVLIADGELQIELRREQGHALLLVRWSDEEVVRERVSPPTLVASSGPWFRPQPGSRIEEVGASLAASDRPMHAVADLGGRVAWYAAGTHGPGVGQTRLLGTVEPVAPAHLGSQSFLSEHGVRYAYVAGAMAGAISSVDLVLAMARSRLLSFYGAGGVPLAAVDEALGTLAAQVGDLPWGANLLHNPAEPVVEEATVDLLLKHGVRRVSASAYMGLTAAVVRYRLAGIHRDAAGKVVTPNQVFAKVSRPEVAAKFLEPAPAKLVAQLVEAEHLTAAQAELAKWVPMAAAITAEADSAGHTDHRPLTVLLPEILRLRDEVCARRAYPVGVHVGAAGGLGTPEAVWAAFALGADYVLTGSVNQATLEAGTSALAKKLLSEARFHEVASGPAPDMFELGAKVQVLSRGSLYAQRAGKLYEIFRGCKGFDDIEPGDRKRIEKQIFRRSLDEVWEETEAYWTVRDPAQVARAKKDGRHQVALTFRWYLGMTSRWARMGDEDRKRDFQIWCGPAMGAFNTWAAGGLLEPLDARSVTSVADALMDGAAVQARRASHRALVRRIG
jgi:trans-AT polyketide synthase, acyltransferase and oxidoreductase domains